MMSLRQLLKEPFVHFVVLAALLFGIDHLVEQRSRPRIVVDRQTVDYLIGQREEAELRTLTEAERRDTVAAYVEDEILYQEAYRRGLDRGDSRMRRNLILKMRGLLVGDVPEPTEAELVSYYQDNLERFTRSASLTLDQIYFPDASAVPEDLLTLLESGASPDAFGEPSMHHPRRMPGMTRKFLVSSFGAESARAILEIADDAWHGPLESPRGVHFVRVAGRVPERIASFAEVSDYLQGDWMMLAARRAVAEEVTRLRDDYQVIVAGEQR